MAKRCWGRQKPKEARSPPEAAPRCNQCANHSARGPREARVAGGSGRHQRVPAGLAGLVGLAGLAGADRRVRQDPEAKADTLGAPARSPLRPCHARRVLRILPASASCRRPGQDRAPAARPLASRRVRAACVGLLHCIREEQRQLAAAQHEPRCWCWVAGDSAEAVWMSGRRPQSIAPNGSTSSNTVQPARSYEVLRCPLAIAVPPLS